MAQYKVGDNVRFFIPASMLGPRNGFIIEVVLDTDAGAAEDSYRIRTILENGNPRTYTGRNRHITLLAQDQEVEDGRVIPAPNPAPAEDRLNDLAIPPNINWGVLDMLMEPTPAPRTREDDIRQEAERNIENYRLTGVLPVRFIVLNSIARPVYPVATFRGALTGEDYSAPVTKTRFFQHYVSEENLSPTYNDFTERIEFISIESGDIWVNQYQNINVTRMADVVVDQSGVRWTRNINLIAQNRPIIRKSNKKLRHKYKEMPVIKEEKYYASKEFIA